MGCVEIFHISHVYKHQIFCCFMKRCRTLLGKRPVRWRQPPVSLAITSAVSGHTPCTVRILENIYDLNLYSHSSWSLRLLRGSRQARRVPCSLAAVDLQLRQERVRDLHLRGLRCRRLQEPLQDQGAVRRHLRQKERRLNDASGFEPKTLNYFRWWWHGSL